MLLDGIELGLGIGLVSARANTVDLLVDLGSVMVALLTGSGHSERDTTWMPCTDAGHFAQTLVGLSGQLAGVPSGSDTLVTSTLGHTNRVDHFVLGKYLVDGDLLLEVVSGELDLVGYAAAVQLNLHDVRLLLTLLQQFHLVFVGLKYFNL